MAVADSVIQVAMAQIGKPYVWAAAGPNSFDCSGLVVYAFKNGAGLNLPHFTGSLWAKYPHISKTQIAPGDLVFPNPSHVGIAISGTQIVVAPHTGSHVQVQNISTVWGVARVLTPGTAVGGTTPRADITPVGLIPGQDQIQQIFDVFKQINGLVTWVNDPNNWKRAGMFAAGGALVTIGIIRWDNTKAIVKTVAKVAK